MPTISDYLQQPVGSGLSPVVGTWVQLTNNATSTAYVATAATNANGKYTVNNVPAGTYTVATGPASIGPFTSTGDTNYVVAANPYFVDITDFGAKADNSTDNSAAFTSALAQLPSTGGTIYFPAAALSYNFASAINLTGKSFIRLKGAGPVVGSGSSGPSIAKFTGTSGPLLNAGSSTAVEMEDLMVQWPNTFNGVVVSYDGSTLNRVAGCFFQATGGGNSAGLILSLDSATRVVVERCVFHNAVAAIQGLSNGAHFSNVVTIRECNFNTAQPNGDISASCIANPGQGWLIQGNTFEMGQAVGNVVVVSTSLSSGLGVKFSGNWIGDLGANAVTLLSIGSGWEIDGNYIGGNASSTAISVPNSAAGIAILGNEFATHSVGVLIGTTVNRIIYAGNVTASVTTEISGTPNSGGQIFTSGTQTLYGASQVTGGLVVTSTMTLQGAEQRSTRGPAFTTPFTPDATLGERTEMTLTNSITINAPNNGANGQRLEFWWNQGAGGFTTTYNAVYKTTGWPAISTTANTLTLDVFECARDGTTWRLISRVTGQT